MHSRLGGNDNSPTRSEECFVKRMAPAQQGANEPGKQGREERSIVLKTNEEFALRCSSRCDARGSDTVLREISSYKWLARENLAWPIASKGGELPYGKSCGGG